MNEHRTVVLYHGQCIDGFTAAWAGGHAQAAGFSSADPPWTLWTRAPELP